MTPAAPAPLWRGRTVALLGIVLFAFSLRTAVASLSPVLGAIEADFEVSAVVAGLIGTAPPACYALVGILTPALERRFGLERLAVAAMLVASIGLAGRALAVDAATLLAATAVVFAAVGMGNVLLPPIVKAYFPDSIGIVTTIYSTMMAVSTFLPPLFAVPLADAGGWRFSLGIWAVFAAIAMLPWIALLIRERRAGLPDELVESVTPGVFARLWRLPLAWALTVAFTVSGVLAYVLFAWIPTLLVDTAGVSPATAGALLSLFAAMGLPSSVLVPVLVVRFGATRLLFGVSVAAGLGGVAGLLFAPHVTTWLWVVLLGVSPLLFPLVLVLLGLRTRTHEGSVALSGFVQSVGYAIIALFPFGIGLLHDATGSWTAPLWVLAVVVACAIPAGVIAARPHTIEDEWERRHGPWS